MRSKRSCDPRACRYLSGVSSRFAAWAQCIHADINGKDSTSVLEANPVTKAATEVSDWRFLGQLQGQNRPQWHQRVILKQQDEKSSKVSFQPILEGGGEGGREGGREEGTERARDKERVREEKNTRQLFWGTIGDGLRCEPKSGLQEVVPQLQTLSTTHWKLGITYSCQSTSRCYETKQLFI